MSRLTGVKTVEKTYTITDSKNNITWKIEKYYNDLTFKKGVLRLDYRIVNQGADPTKFPSIHYVQLKSNTPVLDTVNTRGDIMNLVDTIVNCGGGGYTGLYNETNKCAFTKGKYYQAFIIIDNKEMTDYIASNMNTHTPAAVAGLLNVNIKGQVFVSSVKQFTEADGFDDYITDKKTDEVIRGPTLVGYTHPNKLISKEYYQIK